MKNPPSFVVYVVLVKLGGSKKFEPYYTTRWSLDPMCPAFKTRKQASSLLEHAQGVYGKENAYIQQYGPYK